MIAVELEVTMPPAQAAAHVEAACLRYPQAKVILAVPGYDNDPRELWDIPEPRGFLARLSIELSRIGAGQNLNARLDEQHQILLMLCTRRQLGLPCPNLPRR